MRKQVFLHFFQKKIDKPPEICYTVGIDFSAMNGVTAAEAAQRGRVG